jgi:hypothetical protein
MNYIDSINPNTDVSSCEWDVSDFTECKRSLERRQCNLIKLDLIDLLCNLIKSESSLKIKVKAIEMSISLIIGGNKIGQTVFHKNMLKDPENMILLNIKNLLDLSFDYIKQKMSEHTDNQLKPN